VGRVLSRQEAILYAADEKRNGRRVVFTNGCFDLLHPGHIRCLEQARSLGDVLIVGVNSDASVRAIKGTGRPLVGENERAETLAALAAVDAVVIFHELSPQEIIARVLPGVLVKGADWGSGEIAGREEVEAAGGVVTSVPIVPGYSTSGILARIRSVSSRGQNVSASHGPRKS
jgi:D-beta-D-heptose 7-phosphate kinase/D-beta-D-heptose 1-phosphate adenosyltransferase